MDSSSRMNGDLSKIENNDTIDSKRKPVLESGRKEGYTDTQIFKDNFGTSLIMVGMYGKPVRGKLIATFTVGWNVTHLVFLLYTLYHSIIIDFDLGLFAATLFYVLMASSCSFTIVNFQYYKKNLEDMYYNLETNFYNYKDTIDPDSQAKIDKERAIMTARKQFFAKYLTWLFMVTPVLNFVLFPIILGPSEPKDDYIHRNLPVKCYYPISTVNVSWPAWIWMLFIEYVMTYIILGAAVGTDVPFLCFSEECLFQITALEITLRNVIQRAKYIYEKKQKGTSRQTGTPQFSDCLKECISHSVKHHYEIIKGDFMILWTFLIRWTNLLNFLIFTNILDTLRFLNNVQTIYYYLLLVIMIGGTFLLCTSGVLFVSDSVELKEKMQFCVFLISVLFHIFMFSFYGELMTEKSQMLGEQLYNAQWQKHSGIMKNYVLIMQAYSQKPFQLSAGGFMVSNLNNFGNVLSSAYSYFNLLTIMSRDD